MRLAAFIAPLESPLSAVGVRPVLGGGGRARAGPL